MLTLWRLEGWRPGGPRPKSKGLGVEFFSIMEHSLSGPVEYFQSLQLFSHSSLHLDKVLLSIPFHFRISMPGIIS